MNKYHDHDENEPLISFPKCCIDADLALKRELVDALESVNYLVGIHGPCEHNSCSKCRGIIGRIRILIARVVDTL